MSTEAKYIKDYYVTILTRRDQLKFILVLPIFLLESIFDILSIGLIIPIISIASRPESNIKFKMPVIQYNLSLNSSLALKICIVGALISIILKVILNIYSLTYVTNWQVNLRTTIANQLYAILLKKNYIFHSANSSSALSSLVQQESVNIASFGETLLALCSDVASLCFLLGFLALTNLRIALISLVLFTCVTYTTTYLTSSKLQALSVSALNTKQEMNIWLNQGLRGVLSIQAMNLEKFFLKQFARKGLLLTSNLTKSIIYRKMPKTILETTLMLTLLAILYYAVATSINTENILPRLATSVLALFKLIPAANKIYQSLATLNYFGGSVSIVKEYFQSANYPQCDQFSEKFASQNFCFDNLQFDSVSFNYSPSSLPVIDTISFSVYSHMFYGIIGPSGTGKSTLLNLALGLLRPSEGQVLINSSPIISLPHSWRNQVGVVTQDVFIIDGTIRDNITLELDESMVDTSRLNFALEYSCMDTYLVHSNSGINTRISEDGLTISGGQRQRIALARALYRMPQLLFLDEATSALDLHTQEDLLARLKSLTSSMTIILVTHRLEALKYFDDCLDLSASIP